MRRNHPAENPAPTGEAALFGTSAVITRTFDTPEFRRIRTTVSHELGIPPVWGVRPGVRSLA